jgi:YegS/Rv2252/BmrU family lipid kinase
MIVNPSGGTRRGLAILDQVHPLLARHGIALDVYRTEHRGHATEIVRLLDFAGLDGLGVIGGDGTIHEVVNGLLARTDSSRLPLGLIPAGTGNTIQHDLGCDDPVRAVENIVAGRRRKIDAVHVSMPNQVAYCLNIVGWGAVTDINRTADRWRMLGPSRYAAATLWHVVWGRPRRTRLVQDGEASELELLFAIGCNTTTTGRGMLLAPQARIDDGKVDLVVLRRCSRLQMLRMFLSVYRGTHLVSPHMDYRQVRSFSILDEHPEPLNLDGEILGESPLSAEVVPGAVEVFG